MHRFKKILIIISVLLAFFVSDRIIGYLLKPYYDAAAGNFYKEYETSSRSGINAEVIFTGDSQAMLSIDPDIFSPLCGCSSHNLGMSGGNMITTYYRLRRYLELNEAP